ncbi:hypothetical protein JCM10212_006186 [Sporobolomyces blumeae]
MPASPSGGAGARDRPSSASLLPLSTPARPIRPKSAGSASLPLSPTGLIRSTSWESERISDDSPPRASIEHEQGTEADSRGRTSSRKKLGNGSLKLEPVGSGTSQEGPFADPLRSSLYSDSGGSALAPPADLSPTYFDYGRRNSAVSTSSLSQSPSSPTGPHHANSSSSRHRYSIASSSYAYTIGDLSTSSMPLLKHCGPDETGSSFGTSGDGQYGTGSSVHGLGFGQPSGSGTPAANGGHGIGGGGSTNRGSTYSASSSSRVYLAGSSRASIACSDDGSSVHSYPPKPRQRTGSSWNGSEAGESGYRNSWARELEMTAATGQVRRRGSADSRSDPWPSYVSHSYVHQPIAKPAAAYLSQLSSYAFPAPAVNGTSSLPSARTVTTPANARTAALGTSNPLAPLRKRLARSLAGSGSGGRLHTEVQLMLELIDALEHCMTLFSATPKPDAANDSSFPSLLASSPTCSSPHAASGSPQVDARDPLSSSVPQTPTQQDDLELKTAVLDEVRLLVRELVELVPDAQRCLTNGQYGPLASANTTTKRLLESLDPDLANPKSTSSATRRPSQGATTSRERPRRTAFGTDSWPSRLARDCRTLLDEAGLPTGKGSAVWQLAARLSEQGVVDDSRSATRASMPTGPQQVTVVGAVAALSVQDEHDRRIGPLTSSSPPSSSAIGGSIDDSGTSSAGSASARRDELLQQGKRRWEEYRQQQKQKGADPWSRPTSGMRSQGLALDATQ